MSPVISNNPRDPIIPSGFFLAAKEYLRTSPSAEIRKCRWFLFPGKTSPAAVAQLSRASVRKRFVRTIYFAPLLTLGKVKRSHSRRNCISKKVVHPFPSDTPMNLEKHYGMHFHCSCDSLKDLRQGLHLSRGNQNEENIAQNYQEIETPLWRVAFFCCTTRRYALHSECSWNIMEKMKDLSCR
ncbi:uncharacterized protein LOC122532501 [Frieseomelitta varia]|uniref:uncharacterized protein LOC122532501 n=1 Tax=Frieseomelitta varia TaxID=561572 RepID=UPI001CB6A2E1|nr:uncharacterized protein LOC122532501 [Frieseomelitta varia]